MFNTNSYIAKKTLDWVWQNTQSRLNRRRQAEEDELEENVHVTEEWKNIIDQCGR